MSLLRYLTSLNASQWVMLLLSALLVIVILTLLALLIISKMSSTSAQKFKTNLVSFQQMLETVLPTVLKAFTQRSSTDQPRDDSQTTAQQSDKLQAPQEEQSLLQLAESFIAKLKEENNEKH